MKKNTQRVVLFAWIVVSTIALARLWLVRTDLFPPVPQPFAIWLTEQYGATNAEEIRDLEVLLGLGGAFIIMTSLTFLALALLRKMRRLHMDR